MDTAKYPDPDSVKFKPVHIKASGSLLPPKIDSASERVNVTLSDGTTERWKVFLYGPFKGPLRASGAEKIPEKWLLKRPSDEWTNNE